MTLLTLGIYIDPEYNEWTGIEVAISPDRLSGAERRATFLQMIDTRLLNLELHVQIDYYKEGKRYVDWLSVDSGYSMREIQQLVEQYQPRRIVYSTTGSWCDPLTGATTTAQHAVITPENTPSAIPERSFWQNMPDEVLEAMGVPVQGLTSLQKQYVTAAFMIKILDQRGQL